MPFLEVSAKSGENIGEAFRMMGEELIEKYIPNKTVEDPGLLLNIEMEKEKEKKRREKKACEC